MEGLNAHGIEGLILVLGLHLIVKVGEFAYKLFQKKSAAMEKNVEAMSRTLKGLEVRQMAVERDLNTILKFRNDFNKLFSALKFLAGDKWPEIHEKLKHDHLP